MAGITHFPNGVSSFGMPVLGGSILTTGTIFFYDDATGSNSNTGLDPDHPLADPDYAVGQCTANKNDYIVGMPNSNFNVSSAGLLALDVAGITLRGLGSGTNQASITCDTAATADIDIDAANVTVEGFNIIANYADNAVIFDVNATDFTLRGCRFTQAADDMNGLICVQDAAAAGSDRITIEDCYALMYDASNTHFTNLAGTGAGHIIRFNTLIGDWGTMCLGGAGVLPYITITDNVIYNAATTVDGCINLAATSTGIVARNLCGGAAAQANGITATACTVAENYYGVIAEDLSGILDPIAT